VDSSLAVVNKGAGLVSVPAPNCKISALSIVADFLGGRLKARDSRISAKSLPHDIRKLKPLPVHRLDQYTSGIFCMAMNPESREVLIEQLKAHTMKREYVAFAHGRAAASKGTWRHWLQLSKDELSQKIVPESQARPAGADAVEAITHFEAIAEYQRAEELSGDGSGLSVAYANARAGHAGLDPADLAPDLKPLFETIMATVPAPTYDPDHPLQALVTNLDSSPYVGRLALLRIRHGVLRKGAQIAWCRADGTISPARVVELYITEALDRVSPLS
jgi:hypothetical protein